MQKTLGFTLLKSTERFVFVGAMVCMAAWSLSLEAIGQLAVDPALKPYRAVPGVSGQLKSVGSDSMNPLMLLWTEKFKGYYKGVRTEVEGQGSSKAMPALIEGASSFGPMSRDAKSNEIADFEKKFGYKPMMIPTAIDLLAVYVHRDNPLTEITLPQLDSIFSSTRKLGGDPIDQWGDLGLTGKYETANVAMFGRNAASGTYGFFKEKVLGNGDYGDLVNEQPGSTAVIQSVGENPFAIGYSGVGFKTASVKTLSLATKPGQKAFPPTSEHAYSGDYPLARYLYLAINHKPGSKLDPVRREFLRFIFSQEGQELVIKEGSFPIDAPTAAKALKLLGIDP
jgi:phosphate transport system substrate-binding protein